MKLNVLLIMLLICCSNTAFSQYDYFKTYTGNNDTHFDAAQPLNTYHKNTVTGGQRLTSLNNQGQINWSKQIFADSLIMPNTVSFLGYNRLAATSDGGFIGVTASVLNSPSNVSLGIATRFDSLGNVIWSKKFERPNENIIFDRIFELPNNEYLILAHAYAPSLNQIPSEWLKIDGNGNLIWKKRYTFPATIIDLTAMAQNSVGYLLSSMSGTVVQIDFSGNIVWVRNHEMRIKNIFSVGNEYILIGHTPFYIDHVWTRVTNSGTTVWTKILPNNFTGPSFGYERYKKANDGNIIDILTKPTPNTPNMMDIFISKYSIQNGEILWSKRYAPNVSTPTTFVFVKDFSLVSDSIFNVYAFINYTQISNYLGHFMHINIGYNPNAMGCVVQNEPFIPAYNATIPSIMWQPVAVPSPITVQNINVYSIDVPLVENIECENGVAANFHINNHLLCINECISITDTSSGGIASWEWIFFGTDTTYHSTKYPSAICYPNAGTFSVQLIVSDGFLSDTMRKTIKVFQLPEIDLGQETTFCQGEFIVPYFQIPNANFLWSTEETTPYSFINSSGVYSVEVTAGSCYETDTFVVNVTPKPMVNLGADTAFCFVNNVVLDAEILGGNHTYLWQDNSINSQFFATLGGLYSVTVTDTLGCQNTDDILISFNTFSIELGNDTSICQGENLTLNATMANATYLWNNNSTDSILMVHNTGVYTVEVTANGCTKSDTIEVTVHNLPMVNLGNDTTFCNANGYNLIPNTSTNVTYLWQNSATTSSIFINNSGIFSLIITDTLTNCQATDSINIQLEQTANFDLGNDTILCQGENLTLDATATNATYLWNDNSVNSILTVNQTGIYTVEVTVNGCTKSDTISVTVADLPMVDLGNDTTFCNENNYQLIPNTNSNNVNYLWQNSATTSSIFINNSGIYVLTITDNLTNCQATDSVEITLIQANNFDLGNDTILCDNQTILLNAFVQNADYLWHNGSDSSTFLVKNSGLYFVKVSIENCSATDSINVIFITPNQLNLGENRTFCNDEIIELNAFDAYARNYIWQDNSTLPTLEIRAAGTYFVTVFYNTNCQVRDTIHFAEEGEIHPTLPNDTLICNNNPVTLNAYQPNAISYNWETIDAYFEQHNPTDSVIIATLPGEYKVRISNECRAFTQTILIEEEDCGCYPYVPNAFSPNGDGINDFFKVYTNCPLENYNFKIYDRWGGIVFESGDFNNGWDGTKQGQNLNDGVYVWVLTYESPNERGVIGTMTKSGSVTLMK
jgi:gliding motility-associated-like protein